jgi:hypothetical protein
MIGMNKIEDLKKAIDGVKFTAPQKRIIDRLLDGYHIQVINKHRMSGGEWMWKHSESENIEYAGSVYKAFFNVFYQIKKQKGITFPNSTFVK